MCFRPRRAEKHHPSSLTTHNHPPLSPKDLLQGHLIDYISTHCRLAGDITRWMMGATARPRAPLSSDQFTLKVHTPPLTRSPGSSTAPRAHSTLQKHAKPKVCNPNRKNDGWRREMWPFFLHFSVTLFLHPPAHLSSLSDVLAGMCCEPTVFI